MDEAVHPDTAFRPLLKKPIGENFLGGNLSVERFPPNPFSKTFTGFAYFFSNLQIYYNNTLLTSRADTRVSICLFYVYSLL